MRLYRNKVLLGLKNNDIGDLLNKELGKNYDESKYRKHADAYIEGWDDCLLSQITEEEVFEKLETERDELYKQQVKTGDKLREYRKLLRTDARIENLKDIIIDSAEKISKNKPFKLNKDNYIETDKIGIIQISDWHFDEIVDNFLNKFDHEEFDRRIEKLTKDVIKYGKSNDINTLKVLNHNDLISGNIHVSTRVMSEEDAIFQTQYVAEALGNVLFEWGKEFNKVEFLGVLDNHSRLNKNKKEHIEKENLSKFIPWFLKVRLKDVNNVEIIDNSIDENIGIVDIFNKKAFFVHGHLDSNKNVIQNLTLMTKIFPIAVFTSHIHHNVEDEVHSIDLIVNPSLIGTNYYAKDIRKTSMARQKMTIYENIEGKVNRLATYFITF